MLDPVMSPLSIENILNYKNKSFFYVFKRDEVNVFIICSIKTHETRAKIVKMSKKKLFLKL